MGLNRILRVQQLITQVAEAVVLKTVQAAQVVMVVEVLLNQLPLKDKVRQQTQAVAAEEVVTLVVVQVLVVLDLDIHFDSVNYPKLL